MSRDELNKAAEEAAEKYINASDAFCNEVFDGFIQGASWLMQQPLSERLTKEEKKKIKAIMKYPQRHTEPIEGTLHFQVIGIQKILTEIFGKDLFKEK